MITSTGSYKQFILPVAVLTLIAIISLAGTTAVSGSTLSLTPEADAYVLTSAGDTNFGLDSFLDVKNGTGKVSYLRFNISDYNSGDSVLLRLYAPSGGSGIDVYAVDDTSWQELSITGNNAPPLGNFLVASGNIAVGSWVEMDVSNYITGNGPIAFALVNDSSILQRFSSHEAGANSPQLLITTDDPLATETSENQSYTPSPQATIYPTPTPPSDNGCKSRGQQCIIETVEPRN